MAILHDTCSHLFSLFAFLFVIYSPVCMVVETPSIPKTDAGPVKAVMFTRFEDVEGYVVAASDPPNVMPDQFKEIGYQFLPDKGICWRLISLAVGEFRITGVPVHIDDAKYARRAFVFCFCLIVDNRATELGKIAAQYLAEAFFKLETSSSFLSDETHHDNIRQFLVTLRQQLNSDQVYGINLHIAEDVMLQFSKPLVKPIRSQMDNFTVKPWHVPIAQVFPIQTSLCYDLGLVLSACTGDESVSDISSKLRIDFGELVLALNLLVKRELVVIMDQPIDKYSRVRLTKNFHTFFDDLTNRQTAVAFAIAPSSQSNPSSTSSTPPTQSVDPSGVNLGDQLVRMYCRLDGNIEDLGEFTATQGSTGISTRLMVMFGILKKFIRMKTMFPVFNDYETSMIPVLRSCDGSRSWDEIGFKHGLTRDELNELFTYHGVIRIWR
jgi:hypothetical protein